MTNEEMLFAPHEIGAIKIEGEPYRFFRQWDQAKRINRYWVVRDGMQNAEPMEKTGGGDAVWYKNGGRLDLNTSATLNAMERDYRIAKERPKYQESERPAASEGTDTIATPQTPLAAKASAPAKTYERAETGTLTIDGDIYRIFRTWKQSGMFGAYVYERCLEGAEKAEAIYKSTATGRAAWQNVSGRDFDIPVSMTLSALDDKAGYQELQNHRNFLEALRKPQKQKKSKAKPDTKPAPSSTIAVMKAAQKRTVRKLRQAMRAPRRRREVGESYKDGDIDDEMKMIKPPFYTVDVFTDDTGMIQESKWIKDPAETYDTVMGIKKTRADKGYKIRIRCTTRKGYDQDISIGVLKKIISEQARKSS